MEVTIDGQKTFIREITLSHPDEEKEIDLVIHQLGVGEEGCVVWDAALVLLNYLFTAMGQKSVKNKNVIELGSGTGVVGLAAVLAGASSVCITDLPKLLPLINLNIKANYKILSNILKPKDEKSFKRLFVQPLTWGENEDIQSYFKYVQSNFNVDGSEKIAACILIADCIYYEEGMRSLCKTVVDLLSLLSESSSVLCSYEYRTTGNKELILKEFYSILKSHNIQINFISPNEMHPTYRCDEIFIVEFKK